MSVRSRWIGAAFATVLAAVSLGAAATAGGTQTRAHVEALASAKLEGRLAGSHGEELASQYIAGELQRIGAKPLPGAQGFLEPFDFTAGAKDGGSSVSMAGKSSAGALATQGSGAGWGFGCGDCTSALSFSDNGDAEGDVVFAGYGIVVPESQGLPYDSYAGLDVKDKIVLVLRYFPEDADPKTRQVLARYSDLRYKAMTARQHGAKAILVATGPRSPNAGALAPMTFDTALAGSGIIAVSVVGGVASTMFERAGAKPIADVQQELDSGNPHVGGFPLPGITLRVHAAVIREHQTGHNVLAYLPASGAAAADKPWLAIGAHYDHLGRGTLGSSLASKDEAGQIHAGADDNASGSAAVLSIARTLARAPRHRNVLIAFWSGEELGLIGSSAFAAHPPLPLDRIDAYFNFDMVGRMVDNKLTIQAIGSSPAWKKLIEQLNVKAGFDLQLQDDPYQPTDVATFNGAGIPCLSFFTGTHVDYHRPGDTPDKIDYEDLDRIVEFASALAERVGETDAALTFARVEQKPDAGGGRAGVRVFTGTIPDYSTEVKGLLLSGVVGGGPAEQAGLRKGDVIVEIAGQTITNIYDYTYALDVLKIGQPAKVVFLREGKRQETTLTPAARK